MNILKNNIMIAEFMGAKKLKASYIEAYIFPIYPNCTETLLNYVIETNNFKYHTSWDWLMPVIKKCNKTTSGYKLPAAYEQIEHALIELNQEKIYAAIIKFIKTYNQIAYGNK